ncbi:MAG: hypothetical protein NZ959_01015 [Armatimonadetes bacterium]|nr:hypothetical protein [Armatimonadota bacterium]MDW8121907.1 hypothetical protein [Armatimonadota bacterium]
MKKIGQMQVSPLLAGLVIGGLLLVIGVIYYQQLTKTMPRPGTPTPMSEVLKPGAGPLKPPGEGAGPGAAESPPIGTEVKPPVGTEVKPPKDPKDR